MTDHVIIPINYIERKPGSDEYRIVGKGVTVEFLSTLIDNPGWPAERICQNYDLTLAELHAAWAFYYDHEAEIDARVNAESRWAVEQTAEMEARRARVTARYLAKTGKAYPEE